MEDLEDFTYLLYVESFDPIHVREVTPKDFYYAQILRTGERSFSPLVERLILNPEILGTIPSRFFRSVLAWISENILQEKILSVENWLEVSFHLCKQRWDQSMDWLESQPMSKVLTMIEIVKKHAEEQEKQVKKAARGKK